MRMIAGTVGVAVTLSLVSACAVSFGGPQPVKTVVGLLHIARAVKGETVTIDQHVLGIDIRFATHDDGITLGYSVSTTVFPKYGHMPTPATGFRWPLGVAWFDSDVGVFHELGWIATHVPEPGDVSLTHRRQLGAGCTFSPRSKGAAVGYRDRLFVEAPIDRDALYVVRYDSNKPFDAVFTAHYGD